MDMQIDPALFKMDEAPSMKASNPPYTTFYSSFGVSSGANVVQSAPVQPEQSPNTEWGAEFNRKRRNTGEISEIESDNDATVDDDYHYRDDSELTINTKTKRQKLAPAVAPKFRDDFGKAFYIGHHIQDHRIPITARLRLDGKYRLNIGYMDPDFLHLWQSRQETFICPGDQIATDNIELCPILFKDYLRQIERVSTLAVRTRRHLMNRLIREYLAKQENNDLVTNSHIEDTETSPDDPDIQIDPLTPLQNPKSDLSITSDGSQFESIYVGTHIQDYRLPVYATWTRHGNQDPHYRLYLPSTGIDTKVLKRYQDSFTGTHKFTSTVGTDSVELCPIIFKNFADVTKPRTKNSTRQLIKNFLDKKIPYPKMVANQTETRNLARNEVEDIETKSEKLAPRAVFLQISPELHIGSLKSDIQTPVYACIMKRAESAEASSGCELSPGVLSPRLRAERKRMLSITARREGMPNGPQMTLRDVILKDEFERYNEAGSRSRVWLALERTLEKRPENKLQAVDQNERLINSEGEIIAEAHEDLAPQRQPRSIVDLAENGTLVKYNRRYGTRDTQTERLCMYVGHHIKDNRIPMVATWGHNGCLQLYIHRAEVKLEVSEIHSSSPLACRTRASVSNVELDLTLFKDIVPSKFKRNARSTLNDKKANLIKQLLNTKMPYKGAVSINQADSGVSNEAEGIETDVDLEDPGSAHSQSNAGIHIGFLKPALRIPVYVHRGQKERSKYLDFEAGDGSSSGGVQVFFGDVALIASYDRGSEKDTLNYLVGLLTEAKVWRCLNNEDIPSQSADRERLLPTSEGVIDDHVADEERSPQALVRPGTGLDDSHYDMEDPVLRRSNIGLEDCQDEMDAIDVEFPEKIPGEYQQVNLEFTFQDRLAKGYDALSRAVEAATIVQGARVAQLESHIEILQAIHEAKDKEIDYFNDSFMEENARSAADIARLGMDIVAKDQELDRLKSLTQNETGKNTAERVKLQSKIQDLQGISEGKVKEIAHLKALMRNESTQHTTKIAELELGIWKLEGASEVKDQEITHLKDLVVKKDTEHTRQITGIFQLESEIQSLKRQNSEKDEIALLKRLADSENASRLESDVQDLQAASRAKDEEIDRLNGRAEQDKKKMVEMIDGKDGEIARLKSLLDEKVEWTKQQDDEVIRIKATFKKMEENIKQQTNQISSLQLTARTKDEVLEEKGNENVQFKSMIKTMDHQLKGKDELVASLRVAAQADAVERRELTNITKDKEDDIAGLKIIVGDKDKERFDLEVEKNREIDGLKHAMKSNGKFWRATKEKVGKITLAKTAAKKDEMIKEQAIQIAGFHQDWADAKNEHLEEVRRLESEREDAELRHREELQRLKDENRAGKKRGTTPANIQPEADAQSTNAEVSGASGRRNDRRY